MINATIDSISSRASPIRRRLVLNAGSIRIPEFAMAPGGGLRSLWLPSLFVVIEHHREGIGLFDTGCSHRFFEATQRWPYCLYRWITHVRIPLEKEAVHQLSVLGIQPLQVRWIILSHFDPDHIGGLRDFPAARILCSASAHRAIADKNGIAALRARILPELLPSDLDQRLVVLPEPAGPPIGPFPASLDLFGDGCVRIVDLPGHMPGHLGAFICIADEPDWFLAADACWSRKTISLDKDRRPPFHAHRFVAANRALQDRTYKHLQELNQRFPDIVIIPSHCPEAAATLKNHHSGKASL